MSEELGLSGYKMKSYEDLLNKSYKMLRKLQEEIYQENPIIETYVEIEELCDDLECYDVEDSDKND